MKERPCGTDAGLSPGITTSRSLEVAGADRAYRIHLPADYQPTRPTPLLLVFHGRGGTAAGIEAFSGFNAFDTIAVYAQGVDGKDDRSAWQGAPYAAATDDVQFVESLIDQLQATLCVDPDRIFAAGKSNGGGFAALLACRLPHRIAAFAAVEGAFYPGTQAGCTASGPAASILDFHSTADPVIPYAGSSNTNGAPLPAIPDWVDAWARRDGCGPSASAAIGSDVTRISYAGCDASKAVVHYRIEGAGHTWPGATSPSGPGSTTQTISATEISWQFFLDHPLRPAA